MFYWIGPRFFGSTSPSHQGCSVLHFCFWLWILVFQFGLFCTTTPICRSTRFFILSSSVSSQNILRFFGYVKIKRNYLYIIDLFLCMMSLKRHLTLWFRTKEPLSQRYWFIQPPMRFNYICPNKRCPYEFQLYHW